MQLDSYLEIFTTMYGWAFANIIGEVLTGTGLVAIPFALIVFSAWRDAKESAVGGGGVMALVEAIMTRLIIAMFVFATCFATTPFTSLVSVDLRYTPEPTAADPSPVTASFINGTGSGYDAAMADVRNGSMSSTGTLSYVPAWWFAVMGISSGINNAVRDGISNADREIRMVEHMARTATIENPRLLADIQRFYSECFVVARSRFLRMSPDDLSSNGQSIVAAGNSDYGPTDVDWMGSQLFRTEPGFYSSMRSYNPVPGFVVDPRRDTDYIAGGPAGTPEAALINPEWGRPTCNEWWLDSANGIRPRMITQTTDWQQLYQRMRDGLTWTSEDKARDNLAMLAERKASPQFVDAARIMGNDYDGMTSVVRALGQGVSTFSVGKKLIEANIEFVPMVNALPMVQAMLLMGMYMFLPLVVFLSGYDLKFMLLGGVAIFTVKFWTVMWFIARWVDAHLIAAMYPNLDGNIFMQEIKTILNGDQSIGYKRMILNTVLMAMFIGLPLLWTAMMGWIGHRFATELGRLGTGSAASVTSPVAMPRRGARR